MNLLSVKNLRVRFHQNGQVISAVKGLSFTLGRGKTVALVGESGSGKSVTALSTVGLLGDHAVVDGSVIYSGDEMIGTSEAHLRRVRGNEISFIFQEPMTSLNPLHTIEKQLAESLELHQNLHRLNVRERVLELLIKVGIRNPETRLGAYPHQLSGGQRQRVVIAMALANKPDLLIADEPTTALDVTIQNQILELLADLKKSERLSMLFITHNLGIVRRIADRVCVLKDGEIVEQGPTPQVFDDPQHPYTKMLLDAQPDGVPVPVPKENPEIISAQKMRVWFPITKGLLRRTVDYVKAVNQASFSIRAGETLGLVGESGSGKTTLALAVMRLISSKGIIRMEGQDISTLSGRPLRTLRQHMQIVFQDPFGSLSPRMTAAQIIAEGLGVHQNLAKERSVPDMVAEIMEEVGLDSTMMGRYPHEFSGGQRQRIAIARAMILRPKLVVLDEPTSALDMTVQLQIINLLRNLQRKWGLAYIFISHDLRVVKAVSHKVMVMKAGDIVEFGEGRQIFDDPQTDYTRQLMSAAFRRYDGSE